MCCSSLVLSRRPKIFKKRPQTLKNPLTPIGSCRELHKICRELHTLYTQQPQSAEGVGGLLDQQSADPFHDDEASAKKLV